MPANPEMINETAESVKRMQEFDVNSLPRTDDFGKQMAFSDVVEPARKLVLLYQKINLSALAMMPEPMVGGIKNTADSSYNCFEGILNFTAAEGKRQRDALVQNVVNTYDHAFNALVQPICFGYSEATDFKALENNARTVLRSIDEMSAEKKGALEAIQEEAQKILAEVKESAAEQGVSQQAVYFKAEAKFHGDSQKWWLGAVVGFVVCALAWLFFRDIPAGEWGVAIASAVATKALVFSLLVYGVFFCAKNYTAHRHNFIVNTHRQNALLTYRNLVNAANFEEGQDIVLMQAARCIFEQRDTGYAKGGNESANVVNFSPVEAMRQGVKLTDRE